jgi:hypothetical protein
MNSSAQNFSGIQRPAFSQGNFQGHSFNPNQQEQIPFSNPVIAERVGNLDDQPVKIEDE